MIEYSQFRNFLEHNGYTKEFDIEFERQHPGYHMDANLWEILGADEYFLARAFDWMETAQGREFWAEVDLKWYSAYICQQKKETKEVICL